MSSDLRRSGIGRKLFLAAKEWAGKNGAKKLYISAHSAVESQAFYRAMGCVEAVEYDRRHVAAEPYDCQLECRIDEINFGTSETAYLKGIRRNEVWQMSKKLSEMSLEELWQLFPIFLTEHNVNWALWYAEEEALLKKCLPAELTVRISHIGSTAVPGIWAKPIIDIIVEVIPDSELHEFKSVLEQNGYLCMCESERRISFNKGYTEKGFAEKVYHLHLRKSGDHDELYFRDYLNSYPEVAKKYEKLKLDLWKQYEHDRDGYTERKTAFVEAYTQEAKQIFKNRY